MFTQLCCRRRGRQLLLRAFFKPAVAEGIRNRGLRAIGLCMSVQNQAELPGGGGVVFLLTVLSLQSETPLTRQLC